MDSPLRYRKLPGHRRGFLRGSSVWLGPDHLLAVTSLRFREEYKRYYLRDIQAIVIANRPRFHLSTRAAVIGWLWTILFSMGFAVPHGPAVLGTVAVALIAVWIYISAACSCTCRIHTAVSQDPLPSVYRTWTARKFLRAVETEVSKIQGVLETPAAELDLDHRAARETTDPAAEPPAAPFAQPRRTALAFCLLLAAMFADALWQWLNLQHTLPWARFVSSTLGISQIALAIVVLVQYRQDRVRPAQQKLAIATLIATGLVFYGSIVGAAGYAGFQAAATHGQVDAQPLVRFAEQISIGVRLALGILGLAILVLDKPAEPESPSLFS